MRRFFTCLAAVEGAAVALLLVALLKVGAKPCQDLFVESAAACSIPQAAPWALWLAAIAGGLLGVLLARSAFRRVA